MLRLCCMVPVCELYVRWSRRSGGSALCASDEGWKRAWGLRAVGIALVSREGASALGGREMVLELALGWQRHFDGQPSDGGL